MQEELEQRTVSVTVQAAKLSGRVLKAAIAAALRKMEQERKDNMDTIIGNCDASLFLGGKEETTLKSWNSLLGKETIDLYNTSVTKGTQESHGQNFQKLGKDLMSMDEIAVMDGGKCLLQIRGVRPFLSRKYDITKHPNYKYLSDHNPKNAFDIEKFLSTRLSLRPGDTDAAGSGAGRNREYKRVFHSRRSLYPGGNRNGAGPRHGC